MSSLRKGASGPDNDAPTRGLAHSLTDPPSDTPSDRSADRLSDSVRAVDRALEILLAFPGTEGGLSVSELLTRVDLTRPTLYRLLHTLERRGFVTSCGEPQRFRLGPSVGALAHVWNTALNLPDVAQPAMRRLWEATDETVALFVPEGLTRLCVAEMVSRQPLSFRRGVGYRERLLLGASGRVILAHRAEADLAAHSTGLSIDLTACRRTLAEVRRQGYAVSRDELIQGAVAIAAPIFDRLDQVVGSLAIFGPSVRMPDDRVGDMIGVLVAEAAAISAALGQRGAPGSPPRAHTG